MPSYASPTKFHKPFSNLIYLGIDFVNIKFTLNYIKIIIFEFFTQMMK